MPTQSQARLFAELIERLEPRMRRAFEASVSDLRANVDWRALVDALTRGLVEDAVAALNVSPAAWNAYAAEVTAAYSTAGVATALQIRELGFGGIGTRFDMQNPRAEDWIRRNVGESIAGFVREQVTTARDIILTGYSRGEGPRTIAVDLAGRTTGPGGARQGGALGLDGPRAERLSRVATGMRTAEGVRGLVVRHADGSLSVRYKVNKATAARIFKAYRAGTAVPERDRVLSETQYSNALLKARADTVAETETANSVMAARAEEWNQLVESQGLAPDDVIKTWRHRRGASRFHRPDHLRMSGKSVRGLETPFVFPDGARLQYAHDINGGAKHVIRCGCDTEYRLDQSRGLA